MNQLTAPEYFTGDDGCALIRLKVTGSDAPAITEAALFDNARHRHGLTPTTKKDLPKAGLFLF